MRVYSWGDRLNKIIGDGENNMKVKQLIRELKKMPQNLEVGFASHDNSESEIQGWAFSTEHVVKSEVAEPTLRDEISCFETMPEEWVSIRC